MNNYFYRINKFSLQNIKLYNRNYILTKNPFYIKTTKGCVLEVKESIFALTDSKGNNIIPYIVIEAKIPFIIIESDISCVVTNNLINKTLIKARYLTQLELYDYIYNEE